MRLIVFYSFKIVTNRLQRVLRKVCKYPKKKKNQEGSFNLVSHINTFSLLDPIFLNPSFGPIFRTPISKSYSIYQRSLNTSCHETSYWLQKKKPQISITEKMSPRKYCKINQLIFNQLRILLIWLLVFLICF